VCCTSRFEDFIPVFVKGEQGLNVFENRVLRRIFEPKRDEVTGGCRKLRNDELHNLCSSPSIIRITKSQRMRWTVHVAHMGRIGMHVAKARNKETTRKTWM
jgi:hypothetical protein